MLLPFIQSLIELAKSDYPLFLATIKQYLSTGALLLLLIFVVTELLFWGLERLGRHLLPKVRIPLLSSLLVTIMMPFIYMVQLIFLSLLLLWLIPKLFTFFLITPL